VSILSSFNRATYSILRKTIRENIMLNSRVALKKRFAFGSIDQEVMMGGVVVRRVEMVELIYENSKLRISKFMPKADVEKELCKRGTVLDVAQVDLQVFDGSGCFDVCGSINDQSKELRLQLFKQKLGDVVFILGQVIPQNCSEGYFLLPTAIFGEQEYSLYKNLAYKQQLAKLKETIDRIKNSQEPEFIGDALSCAMSSMDTIRLFLKKDPRITPFDYYWLARVAYDRFSSNPSTRLAHMVARYHYICRGPVTTPAEREELFKDMCDALPEILPFLKRGTQ
jgi:hypothetical protein